MSIPEAFDFATKTKSLGAHLGTVPLLKSGGLVLKSRGLLKSGGRLKSGGGGVDLEGP